MAIESSVKEQFCQSCNADVRPGSLFCYSCGSAVAENGNEQSETKKTSSSANQPIGKPDAITGKPIGKPFLTQNEELQTNNAKAKNKQLIAGKETVLQTAAAVRKQTKPMPKKNVEVVWEQPGNSVNIVFILATLILVGLSVAALMVMLYLH